MCTPVIDAVIGLKVDTGRGMHGVLHFWCKKRQKIGFPRIVGWLQLGVVSHMAAILLATDTSCIPNERRQLNMLATFALCVN